MGSAVRGKVSNERVWVVNRRMGVATGGGVEGEAIRVNKNKVVREKVRVVGGGLSVASGSGVESLAQGGSA